MDAADTTASPVSVPLAHRRRGAVARLCATFLPLVCIAAAGGLGAYARQPVRPAAATAPAPTDGLRDVKNPDWSTDPSDPFPMPADWANVELMKQSPAEAYAKSVGCMACHKGTGDPHGKDTLRLGCTDCHGGDAAATDKNKAHVLPKNPQFWLTSANPSPVTPS